MPRQHTPPSVQEDPCADPTTGRDVEHTRMMRPLQLDSFHYDMENLNDLPSLEQPQHSSLAKLREALP
jgi:hypothetical protein